MLHHPTSSCPREASIPYPLCSLAGHTVLSSMIPLNPQHTLSAHHTPCIAAAHACHAQQRHMPATHGSGEARHAQQWHAPATHSSGASLPCTAAAHAQRPPGTLAQSQSAWPASHRPAAAPPAHAARRMCTRECKDVYGLNNYARRQGCDAHV